MKIPHMHLITTIGLFGADAALFMGTNASKVASAVVILAFCLLAASFYTAIYGVLKLLQLYGLTVPHKRRLSAYVAGFLAALLALQSIGELASRDILVLAPLLLLGYAYTSYSKGKGAF